MNSDNQKSNPLLEALPKPMSEDEFYSTIADIPVLRTDGSLQDKLDELGKLAGGFFIPLPIHFRIWNKVITMLRDNYASRNQRDYIEALVETKREYDDPTRIRRSTKSMRPGASLIGAGGMGKTTILERLFDLIPKCICHPNDGLKQVPVISLDCTIKGSTKQLCHSFFSELDEALRPGSKYFDQLGSEPEERLMIHMKNKILKHRLGLLVVDEIHNLTAVGKPYQKKVKNFFKELANRVKVPILYVGTDQAVEVLFDDLQTGTRAEGLGMPRLEVFTAKDPNWLFYIDILWTCQVFSEPGELTEELRQAYFKQSKGIIRKINAIHRLAQEIALDRGETRITPELIAATREEFPTSRQLDYAFEHNTSQVSRVLDDLSLSRASMYDDRQTSKRKGEQKRLEELAKAKWKKVSVGQLRSIINILLRDFADESFEVKQIQLEKAISNLDANGKLKAKKKLGDPKGDLIDICKNGRTEEDIYDLLLTARVIKTTDEALAQS